MKFSCLFLWLIICSCAGPASDNTTEPQTKAEANNASTRKHGYEHYRQLRLAAWQFGSSGKLHESIAADSAALIVATELGNDTACLSTIKALQAKYYQLLNRMQVLELCNRGVAIAKKTGNYKDMADLYSAIGLCYFFFEDIDKALAAHRKSLEISRNAGYEFGISSALVDIGSDYIALNRTAEAIPYYLEVEKYAPLCKGTIYEAYIYNSVAAAYWLTQRYDSAFMYSEKACAIARTLGNSRGIISTTATMARIEFLRNNTTKAKLLAEQALQQSLETRFAIQLPPLYLLLSEIHEKEKNFGAAHQYFRKHIHLKDSIADEKTLKVIRSNELEATIRQKENEKELLQQSNQISELKVQQTGILALSLLLVILLLVIIGIARQRQAALKANHQLAIAGQQLLRAQMNPHFIFNSLNSIQALIMQNQNLKAENYLGKFSILLRNILETGSQQSVTLMQEIQMLNDYLHIESVRFDSRFTYSVQADEELNRLNPRIPHMMIQPFAENAVWHGLLPKKGDCELSVLFRYENQSKLTCIIDDNGVGREESAGYKNPDSKKQQAISFTQSRLAMFNTRYKTQCTFDIEDKYDQHGKALGTKITIQLPIIKK
ncbi:MAG: histidine kinase [Bacteroidia bacterium]|jgi:tetratricopeptide (TPR) repeat protein|nr:histidine kinase [Bacteroidia bacterium]